MRTKTQLRQEIARKRTALEPAWIASASNRIVERMESLNAFRQAETVALYKAIRGEVDLEPLFQVCWNAGKRTGIPVFNTDKQAYDLAEITQDIRYKRGRYGIQEPLDASPLPVGQVDLMIVPGVAFDPSGNRLGRGGGYYDRLLDGYTGHAAGAAFDFQVYPHIPFDSHDFRVNCIVTETKAMKVPNEH